MRITLEADYALRIMSLMAQENAILDAGTLAQRASVTPGFTLKILRKLVKGELVESYKGSCGGYKLKTGAENTTLRRVIELIDGPLSISKCVDHEGGCPIVGANKSECVIHHIFAAVSDELSRKLDGITIAQVADKNASLAELIGKIRS